MTVLATFTLPDWFRDVLPIGFRLPGFCEYSADWLTDDPDREIRLRHRGTRIAWFCPREPVP